MKKSILIGLLFSSLVTSTYAKTMVCPFTDYFAITAPAGYAISSLVSDGNVVTENQGPRNFIISCKDKSSKSKGKAYLTLSKDKYNLCTLHIVDGPFEMNPTVSFINCAGDLQYAGIDHVWGTYTYTLKFTS